MKKIIIIGGGVSGLAAGIYAQKSGFESIILERHYKVGGLCTWWDRKGYHLDGCIHWLTGTTKGTDLYSIWSDLGALNDGAEIYYQDIIGIVEYKGEKLHLYADPKKLEEEFLRVAPEDKKQIHKLMKYFRLIVNVPLPLHEAVNVMKLPSLMMTGIRMIPYLPFMLKMLNLSCEKYAKKFKSPIMKMFLTEYQPGPGNLYAMIYSFGTILYHNGGIPSRVSRGFVDSLENRYKELGGVVRTSTEVDEVIVNNKVATGVKLKNGEIIDTDYIVSAVDAHTLIVNLLKKQYKDKAFTKRLFNTEKYPCPSCYLTYFAVNKDKIKDTLKANVTYFPIKGIKVGNREIKTLSVRSFGFDPYFDKDNNTVIEVYIEQYNDSYAFWNNLFKKKDEYNKHKLELANSILDCILKQYPNLKKEDFEYLDSFSPKTLERYTNAFMGSYMSFMLTTKSGLLMHGGHIKGINNLEVASQWSQSPGGLPLAAATGMFAIQRILKKEKRDHIFFKRSHYKFS